MKKIFTLFAAALTALSMSAASYGILVNGKTYFAGTQVDEFEGFVQYLAHVQLKSGDFCQLCDADNKAVWAVDINAASVAGMFLTTECVIVDHPEEHPAPAMPAGGMGGMM